MLENIDAPARIMRVFTLALAVGFPIPLVVAWAFELTPAGLKREKEVDRTASITNVTGRRLDRAIIVVLAMALGYFIWDKVSLRAPVEGAAPTVAQVEGDAVRAPERPSIAVLPFANRSSPYLTSPPDWVLARCWRAVSNVPVTTSASTSSSSTWTAMSTSGPRSTTGS